MAARNTEKRNEILQTAYDHFSRLPYHQVSLAMIAQGAGINKSLLQHYYAYKSEIMKALLDELLSASFSYHQSLPDPQLDMFQQISDFNMLFFKAAAKNEQLNQFVTNSAADP